MSLDNVGYFSQEWGNYWLREPRACCLTCHQVVAVTSVGVLRPHSASYKKRCAGR